MGFRERRWMLVFVVLVMGVVFLLGASWGERQEKQEQAADRARLRALLEERQEILEMGAKSAELMLDRGQATPADYAKARAKALKAKLDLVEEPGERKEIFEQILKLHKDSEKTAELMLKSARMTELEFTKYQLRRLRAEIKLVREKMGSN